LVSCVWSHQLLRIFVYYFSTSQFHLRDYFACGGSKHFVMCRLMCVNIFTSSFFPLLLLFFLWSSVFCWMCLRPLLAFLFGMLYALLWIPCVASCSLSAACHRCSMFSAPLYSSFLFVFLFLRSF
jgi:hypothetical protein